MELSELTKIVVNRIQKLDPDNVSKIMGCILLKEPSEQEMIQLAFGPENTLLSKIDEARTMLVVLSPKNPAVSSQNQSVLDPAHQFGSFPRGSCHLSSPPAFHISAECWDPLLPADQHPLLQHLSFTPRTYPDSVGEDYSHPNQAQFSNLEEQVDSSISEGNYYYYQDGSFSGSLPSRTSRRPPSLPEFPIKACHYFFKGYCKHGANCRYYHGQSFPDGYSQAFSSNLNELQSEEHGFSPRSLEKLEMEISDLLRSCRGAPVSISLLPMLYYEKYGRSLQADGYLTESQQHGKAGFGLTKLLSCLKNSIRLIDRPHGQNSIILAEDAPRYLECRNGRSEPVVTAASSHQIYLTFPAESKFNEDDVSNYFKQFGPVRDVRIPCQEKRMYGFVSFLYPETVCEILMKKNTHYICGSRVLVKPYKEKSRMVDRTYIEKSKPSMHYPYHYLDFDSELHAIPRETESSRLIKLHLEEQQKMIEFERRQLSGFDLVQEPLDQQPYFSYGVDDSNLSEDPKNFPLEDHFGFMLDAVNAGLSSYDKDRNTNNNYSDKGSGHIELPDSPFASPPPVGSSI